MEARRIMTVHKERVPYLTKYGTPEASYQASAVRTGLEPVTSCVTGRHSNQAELTHLFLISGCKGNQNI